MTIVGTCMLHDVRSGAYEKIELLIRFGFALQLHKIILKYCCGDFMFFANMWIK